MQKGIRSELVEEGNIQGTGLRLPRENIKEKDTRYLGVDLIQNIF